MRFSLSPIPKRHFTRVAVVQLAFHPAAVLGGRSPLEEPVFNLMRERDLLAPEAGAPPDLDARIRELRERVRSVYCEQLLRRVKAVLDRCRAWGVKLVVFPEYSIPWQLLGDIALASGDLVVVAGTHSVDLAAQASGLYERMGASKPPLGASVCPVIYRGQLLALQPKLNPAAPEKGTMEEGEVWAPVELPEGLPGPMGVLVGLDFLYLYRESDRCRRLVAPQLEACRFLAMPALTPHYTQPELAGKVWEEARRYKRPVLLANSAEEGGSSIFVDEGAPSDLRQFPKRAGYLEAGDEGVIVADVDLDFERAGSPEPWDGEPPVTAFAEATFVYRANPTLDAYAQWLEESAELLAREGEDAADQMMLRVHAGRDVLVDAGALAKGARTRRLAGLLRSFWQAPSMEDLRRLTREVVLPADVLPLPALEGAMAKGASDVVFAGMPTWRAADIELEQRVRNAGKIAAGIAREVAAGDAWGVGGNAEGSEEEAQREPGQVVRARGEPAPLGRWWSGGFHFEVWPRPQDFRSQDGLTNGSPHSKRIPRSSHEGPKPRAWSPGASDVFLLALAEGRGSVAFIKGSCETGGQWSPAEETGGFTLMVRDGGWEVWVRPEDDWWSRHGEQARAALEFKRLAPLEVTTQGGADLPGRLAALRSRFGGARERVRALREERLRDVLGAFVPPRVRVGGECGPEAGALDALDDWLASSEQTALVLGEPGTGKSTTLAAWCLKLWEREDGPRPILVNLASASAPSDPEAMLLEAAGVAPSAQNRAALKLLVRATKLLPCFDGFDALAARPGGGGLVSSPILRSVRCSSG